MSVIVKFLGTAQDGGIPQVGCKCEMCTDIRAGKRKEILQAAVGIENTETGNRYMIEATPNFSKQYQSFIADKNGSLDGIFLTHAHMGHYTGLMYLGKEALNSKETKVYVSKKMAEFLKTIKFTKIQLNSLARKGAERWVKPASIKVLNSVKKIFIENGINNVEIVKELSERKEKIEMEEDLIENMKSIREYSEEEMKKIFKIKNTEKH